MDDRLERNKRAAQEFYDLMFNQCKPREAIEKYAGAMYRQHNPHVADGAEAFIAYFEKMAKEHPGKRVSFKRAFAEGNSLGRAAGRARYICQQQHDVLAMLELRPRAGT